MADPQAAVRRRAAEVAAAWPGDQPPTLTGLLADADGSVVEVACWAAGERTPPELATVAWLTEIATTHDDGLCREAAVAALGAIGAPEGLTAILAATRDKATVRRRAVIALAAFEGPEVDGALEAARSDRDWQVRQAAEDLLADE
jgi:HEAT repeat protein